jgi:hypothetical protein
VLCASRHEAPENFDAFRLVQPLSFSAVIVSCPKKPASRFIHSYGFGVVLSPMSSRLRGRPPFFPMALNCSFVSLAARALPPKRANSETVSTFFIPQVYHREQASHRALFYI